MSYAIPEEARIVSEKLIQAGFEAYFVGGCVRDLLLGREPKDWDITTNAKPEEIQAVFPDSFYENEYGTVGVKTDSKDERLSVIEVTPYRLEFSYSDKRRPDKVEFGTTLDKDLDRRDFTVNAIALDSKGQIKDIHGGLKDIKDKIIRSVGNPNDRFSEDALRMLRAVRLVAELDFGIEGETASAITKNKDNLRHISRERIRDEFVRILSSDRPMNGLILAQQLGILEYIAPELTKGINIEQNKAHKYDVFGHLMHATQHAADKNFIFEVRLAALFHDISKPETRRWSDEKKDWTFYGHEVVGSRVTKDVLTRLKFSRDIIDRVSTLVRWHMFFSDPEKITLSAVRRIIKNVSDDIWNLLDLRICDRIGTGRPKEQPFRFRKYKAMVEQALRDPLSVTMLKTDGTRIMERFRVKAGPKIGYILNALLEEVIDDPSKNTEVFLDKRTEELLSLDENELKELGESGKKRKKEEEEHEVGEILKKYHVQ